MAKIDGTERASWREREGRLLCLHAPSIDAGVFVVSRAVIVALVAVRVADANVVVAEEHLARNGAAARDPVLAEGAAVANDLVDDGITDVEVLEVAGLGVVVAELSRFRNVSRKTGKRGIGADGGRT